jgi:Zn-dependent protease
MITSFFQSGFSKESLIQFLMLIPIVLISLSFHEFCHGYAAYLCGDNTAKNFGRLTMNPLKHLDPVGAIMMLLLGFGWAKPVPINTRNFRSFKKNLAFVSIAGPLSNLFIALVSCILLFLSSKILGTEIYYHSGYLFYNPETMTAFKNMVITFFYLFVVLNVGLAIFNLIPIPPLDGSRILSVALPSRLAYSYNRIEQYTRYIFLGIVLASYIPLNIGPFSDLSDLLFYPVSWVRETIIDGLFRLMSFIFN